MAKFYEIKNQADKVVIYLYGDIVMDEWGKWTNDDKCPTDIVKALSEGAGKPLEIRINSGGGSVFGGLAMYHQIKAYSGTKKAYIDGIGASIASVIPWACDEVIMPANALLMAHKPWTYAYGDEDDLEAAKQSLQTCYKSILAIYGEHLAEGMTMEDLAAQIKDKKEIWLTGTEAAKVFKITPLEALPVAACISNLLDRYSKVPEGIPRARAEPATSTPEKMPEVKPDTSHLDNALAIAGAFIFAENEGSNGV